MNLFGKYRGRETVKCPRCGEKCLTSQASCPECGLVFARLENATNADAVKRLKNGEKKNIIMVKKIPPDKKYWKLILYSTLFGLIGIQYFYVYRWKMGVYMLFCFLLAVILGVYFNAYALTWLNGMFMNYMLAPFTGVYAIVWLNSIVQVIFKKFKIPVSLPYKEYKLEENK